MAVTMLQKQCPNCNQQFEVSATKRKQVHCSKECRAERYRGATNPNHSNAGWHTCETCNERFHSYSKTRRFCSKACAAASPENKAQLEAMSDKIRGGGKGRRCECKLCGVLFYHPLNERTYCDACLALEPHRRYRIPPKICVVCGSEFRHFTKKTCSPECLRVHSSTHQKGDKSHRWQGGKTNETILMRKSLSYKIWRETVYKRDDFTCQLCKERGGKLAAHHIKRFAIHRHLALVPENGITLCWSCHQSIKGKEHLYESQFFAITGSMPSFAA